MVENVGARPGSVGGGAFETPNLPVVPGPRARKILLFEGVVLVEYWLAPLFFGLTNYAGTWSTIGLVLFGVVVGSVVLLVLLPLRRHLAQATRARRDRLEFHGVWAGAFALGLFVTNTFQLGIHGVSTPAVQWGAVTVYTPFGAWPSLTVYLPALGFYGTLNGEILSVLALVSVLGASAIRLGVARSRRSCTVPRREDRSWARGVARLAVWSPLGLITGCASCAPLYLAAVGLFVPSAAATGLAPVPLVPWIGLAGLLYLASFGLAIYLIRNATRPAEPPAPPV